MGMHWPGVHLDVIIAALLHSGIQSKQNLFIHIILVFVMAVSPQLMSLCLGSCLYCF